MSEFTPPGGVPPQPESQPGPWPGAGYSSYGSAPYDDAAVVQRARTSRKMAGWGLALCLLICVPFAPLVGLGLGIAVVVRAKSGGNHGKGMGIAAVVIGGLYLIAVVGLLAVSVGLGIQMEMERPDRDESGRVVEAGEEFYDDLREGDCISHFPDDSATVPVVRCDSPHIAEVFHVYDIEPDDYADQAALEEASWRGCLPEYKTYVGKAYRRSTLELVYYNPEKGDLLFEGDEVICLVVAPSQTSDTLKGSRK